MIMQKTAATKNTTYRQCTKCVLDTNDDPNMTFDEDGVCDYYHQYLETAKNYLPDPAQREHLLEQKLDKIKKDGSDKDYDVVVGLSGGVDSTFVALLAREYGLRVLAVHLDNGWNSELAVKNIESIVTKLDIDLFTYVIDWEEFRDIQMAFLRASVVDIEVVTDHAIFATLFHQAGKHNIRHILSGTNVVTETTLPPHWIWHKTDHVHIKDIHQKFGRLPMKTYPLMNWKVKRYYQQWKGIRSWSILNFVPYDKSEVKQRIIEELHWRDYGGKHYESIFTRFYQGYILPTKFGIDKRKAHLSDLIFSGQISREDALCELQKPICDVDQIEQDREFVIKKFGLSEAEFNDLMCESPQPHTDYATELGFFEQYPFLKCFRRPLHAVKKRLAA